MYGPFDHFDEERSHALGALVKKICQAKLNNFPTVTIWGTGKPKREFLHVDDLAEGILHVLRLDDPPDWVNIGYGEDLPIGELAQLIAKTVGYQGELVFDSTKPDGIPRKLMDNTLLQSTGWKPSIDLEAGLQTAYEDFSQRLADGTLRM